MTRGQLACFAVGMVALWAAADWPAHDVGEQYLLSVHNRCARSPWGRAMRPATSKPAGTGGDKTSAQHTIQTRLAAQ